MTEETPLTLETAMLDLAAKKIELKAKKDEYRKRTQHLRDSIKCLENIITEMVIEKNQTVTVGNIKAELVKTVVIKMKKEQTDD